MPPHFTKWGGISDFWGHFGCEHDFTSIFRHTTSASILVVTLCLHPFLGAAARIVVLRCPEPLAKMPGILFKMPGDTNLGAAARAAFTRPAFAACVAGDADVVYDKVEAGAKFEIHYLPDFAHNFCLHFPAHNVRFHFFDTPLPPSFYIGRGGVWAT